MTETRVSYQIPDHLPTEGQGSIQWTMLAMVFTLQTVYQVGMMAVAPLAPFIQADLRISRAEIGLFPSASSLGALLLTLPSGWILDRVGSRPLLFAGPMTVAVGLFFASSAASFWPIAAWMFITGIGVALTSTAATKAIVIWFSARTRGTAMGIKQTGAPLGAAIAAAMLPGIALARDWRYAIALTAAAVALAAIACLIVYRDYTPPERARAASPPTSLRAVLANRNIRLCCLAGGCFTAAQMILSTDLVLYFTEAKGMTPTGAGALLAFAQMAGVAGRPVMGVVSDRLLGARRKGLLSFTGAGMAGATLVIALAGDGMPLIFLTAIMVLVGVTAFGWPGLFLILTAELSDKKAAGLTVAAALVSVNAGYFVGPPLFGYVVDVSHSYSLAWLLTAAMATLGTIAMMRIRERGGVAPLR